MRRREESGRQARVNALRRDYEAVAGGTPLNVRFVGNISEANLARVVPELLAAELVSKPPLFSMVVDNDDGLRVHVTRSLHPDWIYIGDHVGWVDRAPLPRIVEAVARKAEELPVYRNACGDDVRLLVYADRLLNSGKLELQGEPKIDRMGFSAVYFLSYPVSVTLL